MYRAPPLPLPLTLTLPLFDILPPGFTFQKTQGEWILRSPRRGAGTAPRFAKARAMVFPWKEAGPQAFRLSLRKPFGFAAES